MRHGGGFNWTSTMNRKVRRWMKLLLQAADQEVHFWMPLRDHPSRRWSDLVRSPLYDLYRRGRTLAGGVCKRVTLMAPDFSHRLATRLKNYWPIKTSPFWSWSTRPNPTGSCWTQQDFVIAYGKRIESRDIYCVGPTGSVWVYSISESP